MSKDRAFDWRTMQDKAQQVLGDDFWTEINRVLPRFGPNIDTYKAEGNFVVVIEVPGIASAEEISIKVKGNKLLIAGRIPWAYPVQEKDMLMKERFTGEFKREVNLPNEIDTKGRIDARYKNGIIELRIPTASIEDEKEIPIGFEE